MKKILAITVIFLFLGSQSAVAATKVTVVNSKKISTKNGLVTLKVSNLPLKNGIYVSQCMATKEGDTAPAALSAEGMARGNGRRHGTRAPGAEGEAGTRAPGAAVTPGVSALGEASGARVPGEEVDPGAGARGEFGGPGTRAPGDRWLPGTIVLGELVPGTRAPGDKWLPGTRVLGDLVPGTRAPGESWCSGTRAPDETRDPGADAQGET